MNTVNRRAVIDLALLLTIPLVLLVIHAAVSKPIAANHYFYPSHPSALDAWTAALLHRSWRHVGGNAAAYTLTILTTYLIAWEWGRRRTLWITVLVVLVTTPLATALGDLLVFQYAIGPIRDELNIKGFSGVSSAFLGVLWASIGYYANHETKINIGQWVLFTGFLTAALYFTIIYSQVNHILFFSVGLIVFGYGWTAYNVSKNYTRDRVFNKQYLRQLASQDHVRLIIGGWFIGLLLFVGYYPASITANGSTTNIFSHLLGLGYGFLISVIMIQITD